MDVQEEIRVITELSDEISQKVIFRARDQYERNSLLKIAKLLQEMKDEYANGALKPRALRYGYISRLVAESDPDILLPELGGKLMQAEKRYMQQL